jgi:hypothetical protein
MRVEGNLHGLHLRRGIGANLMNSEGFKFNFGA